MRLNIGRFVIKQSIGIGRFDVYKKSTLETGKDKGKELEIAQAYGVSLERCIQVILDYRLDKDLEDIGLEKFLEEYKSISEKLNQDIKQSLLKLEN